MKKKQALFYSGDRVRIGKFPSSGYSAFKQYEGKLARVKGTYKSECYGEHPKDRHTYSLIIDGEGYSAWFDADVLKLVRRATLKDMKKIQDEKED